MFAGGNSFVNSTIGKKKVLVITHNVPVPVNSGDTLRLKNLLQFFKEEDYEVIVVYFADLDHEKVIESTKRLLDYSYFCLDYKNLITKFNRYYKMVLSQIKRNAIKVSFMDLQMRLAVKKVVAEHKPDVAVAEYIFMAPYLKYTGKKTLKIIDTIDVFSRKNDEECSHGMKFPLACSKSEERRYLLHGDIIMGIQPDETKILKELVPEKRVVNVGVDMPMYKNDKPESENKVILIVGGSNQNNIHGVKFFIEKCWNKIYSSHRDVILRIVGQVGKPFENEALQGVELVGVVNDLKDEYQNADIVVNPVVAGTGLKIKTIEAISCCRPIVSTPNGVGGIVFADDEPVPYIVAVSWDEFTEKIIKLLNSEDECEKLKKAACAYAEKYLDFEYAYKELKEELARERIKAQK